MSEAADDRRADRAAVVSGDGDRFGAPWPGGWRPSAALERAIALAGGLALLGIVTRRPDLIVLAGPFVAGTAIALALRSRRPPDAAFAVDPPALLESDQLTVKVHFEAGTDGGADAVAVRLPPGWFTAHRGRLAGAIAVRPGRPVALTFTLDPVRWGRAPVGPARVGAVTAFGLLRAPVLTLPVRGVLVWPLREAFVATDLVPRAEGVVGPHRSRRPGEGVEVAGVRPFQPGDRLRRINWRVTLRVAAGRPGDPALHVTTTLSDRDTDVLLCVDSRVNLGGSLDTAVRAAAAVAEYYLRAGDRVGLVDLGQPTRQVRPGGGRTHLVRILDVLLDVRDRPTTGNVQVPRLLREVPANALIIAFSPLLGEASVGVIAGLARSSRPVVAVDTLPADYTPPPRGEWTGLAWRVSKLEREADLGGLAEVGVPIVRWQGAGSLDDVLRDASLLARLPRAVR
jgi:uncharacterized protein (DUF58 family)